MPTGKELHTKTSWQRPRSHATSSAWHRRASSRHDAIELLERGSAPPDPHEDTLWLVRGDTLLAAEVALWLRMQWRQVWWVGEQLAGDALPVWRRVYAERLAKRGVELMTPLEFEARGGEFGAVCEVDAHGLSPRAHVAPLLEAFPSMHVLDDVYESVFLSGGAASRAPFCSSQV